MNNHFDIIIIGGGPGGYVTAIRAAQLGMSTALVEGSQLGGVCLNWGCIPTKALLRASEIHHLLQNVGHYGFSVENISFDIAKVVDKSRKASDRLSRGVAHLLKKNNVKVFKGRAFLSEKTNVKVIAEDNEESISANNIIISTGARARRLALLDKLPSNIVWTYREAMIPDSIPKSVLVIGSGAIGIEFASFYHHMGSSVTVVEVLDRILPNEDSEISNLSQKIFSKQGINFVTGAEISDIKIENNFAHIDINQVTDSKKTLKVEKIISAVGIVGNIENLGLENIGINTENNHIITNEWSQTNIPNYYAIGDVAGPPWLAHKASHEGVVCVEKIAGLPAQPLDRSKIPNCTYSMPQIASVGLTEAEAIEKGIEISIGRFPFLANGKAMTLGEKDGLVKTIFDKNTGELLGAHMLGAEVTELIQGYVIARNLETTPETLANSIFPHPTLSESMHESVLDSLGRVIHL